MTRPRTSPIGAAVAESVAAMARRGPYRAPSEVESGLFDALAAALGRGDVDAAADLGARLGLRAGPDVHDTVLLRSDPTTERAWLVVVARRGVVPRVVVEVPHPNSDLYTEHVGLALRAHRHDALFLQAGAHRSAGAPAVPRLRDDYPADVAYQAGAPFAQVAAALGLPEIQLHGFADRDGLDIVLSPGASAPGPLLDAVDRHLRRTGERLGGPDDPDCADLLGRRNAQGRVAALAGTEFVHVEMSRALRRDRDRRRTVASALAAALDAALDDAVDSGL